MPELPEVEVVARVLAPHLCGRQIISSEIRDLKIKPMLPEIGWTHGAAISNVRREGKQVAIELRRENETRLLLVHLRMTGRLIYCPTQPAADLPYLRILFKLNRGWLVFQDTRRFGTLKLLAPDALPPTGLDPLSRRFTTRALAQLLASARTPLKVWLLRQDRLVGMGNIYASESLFISGLHPERPANSLKPDEIARLRSAIRSVLQRAIRAGGTTFSDFRDGNGRMGNYARRLRVYDRAGEPCRVCRTPIEKCVQAQRSTFFCPTCQQ